MKKRGKREGYSVWNHLVYLLRGIWSSDRVLMVLMVLEALSIVITPYVAMYLPKIGVIWQLRGLTAGRLPVFWED